MYIICCRYWLYDSLLMFCYFVCVMLYTVILAWRSGGNTWLQKRDRLMEWSQLFSQSSMNSEVLESWCMMNCEFFTSVIIWCSVGIRLRMHWLVLWRCFAVSISASSSVGRSDVSTKPEVNHLLHSVLICWSRWNSWSTFRYYVCYL